MPNTRMSDSLRTAPRPINREAVARAMRPMSQGDRVNAVAKNSTAKELQQLQDLLDPAIVSRGMVAPWGRDKQGAGQWAVPGIVAEAMKALDQTGQAMRLPHDTPANHPAYKGVSDVAGAINMPALLRKGATSTLGMNLWHGDIHGLGKLGAEHLKRRWGVEEDNIKLNLSNNRHDQKSAYLTGPFGEFRISDHYNNPNFNFPNANAVNPSTRDVVSAVDKLMNMKNAVVSKGNKMVDDWEDSLNAVTNKLKPDWQDDLTHVKKSGTKTAYQKRKDEFLSKHDVTGEEFNKLLSARNLSKGNYNNPSFSKKNFEGEKTPAPNYRKGKLYNRQGKPRNEEIYKQLEKSGVPFA
jgi:hypothetical protein